jgi:hypothetical protein
VTPLDKVFLVLYALNASFCFALLWVFRRLRSDRARRARRQAVGVVVGMSLVPAGILLMDRMNGVTWALLVLCVCAATAVLILRS